MYAGGSLTEPQRPSRMSTNRSGIEDAGIESSDYHAPAEVVDPIGMARADGFHTMSLVLFSSDVHTYVRTYIETFILSQHMVTDTLLSLVF